MTEQKSSYDAESIKVLEGLEAVRKNFNIIELSKKIKKKGDVLILSKELRIKPRILSLIKEEGRILSHFPGIHKSKSNALSRLRTDRELRKFSQLYDVYGTSARKLYKLVKIWNQKIQGNPLMFITRKEHDIIIGSLLGDASIRQRDKNSCFRVSHSIKQEDYIKWILNILNNFIISEFEYRKRIIANHEVNMINLATRTHSVFNFYRKLFYKNGRKVINNEILNQITPRSLAIWICDDGSYSKKQGYIILCTNSYSLEEHKLIKEFFNKKFGLNPTIGFRDGKYYYLRFKKDDTKKIIETIKPFIPKCMLYKIGELNHGY